MQMETPVNINFEKEGMMDKEMHSVDFEEAGGTVEDKGCPAGCCDPGQNFVLLDNPTIPGPDMEKVDELVFIADPDTKLEVFAHFKDFLQIGDFERKRNYYFSPSDDEKALIIRVEGAEWLHVGKNGHVLVLSDGTILFIPYGWIAMSADPNIPGEARYMK